MNRIRFLFPLLILLSLILTPISVFAQSPVTATLDIPEGDWTVGDPIPITLAVDHPAGYHVIAPEIEESWGAFLVQSQSPPTTVSQADGSETTTIMLDTRLFSPGQFSTPPLPLSLTDGQGNLNEIVVEPAAIEITSVLVEGDTTLRDIKPQASMPIAALWPYLLAIVVAITIVSIAIILWWHKRKQALIDSREAHERAFDELERIRGLQLSAQNRYKEHYTLVSDCIRRYMEEAYNVPVMERTTSEIKAELHKASIPQDISSDFIKFLQESDLVKFSEYSPSAEDANALLTMAHDLVERSKPQPVSENSSERQTPSSPYTPTRTAEVTA